MEAEWNLGVVADLLLLMKKCSLQCSYSTLLTFDGNYCERTSFVVKYFKTVIQEVRIKPLPWPSSYS